MTPTTDSPPAHDPAPTPGRRHLRPVRAVVLLAALVLAAVAGTACEPQPLTTCLGLPVTILGTSGNDTLVGTSGPDVIAGLGGRDVISGLGGDDRLCAGDGIDQVYGGEGSDIVEGGLGGDVMTGDTGTDTLHYGTYPKGVYASLLAGQGTDGDLLDTFEDVVGSRFDDLLYGNHVRNTLDGGRGSDLLFGRGGADLLVDQVAAPADRNVFEGGSGSDVMRGGTGTVHDIVSFEDIGAPVFVNLGTQVASGDGEDTFVGMDGAIGSSFADTLWGSSRDDEILGGAGNDLIVPLAGDDVIDGMGHRDRVSFFAAPPVDVDLFADRAVGEGSDVLRSIEDVQGGPGPDTLVGDTEPNVIDGGPGTDDCIGGGGADSFSRCP